MARLLPFEQTILRTVEAVLPPEQRAKYSEQVAHINKVQHSPATKGGSTLSNN